MNKNDLIKELAKHTLTISDAKKFVDIIFNTITYNLILGKKVTIQHFGTFIPKYYKAKKMYNPKKKKYQLISPKEKVKFVVSKNLVQKLNSKTVK
jgi:nucleoid DNA-binding protein